MRWMSNISAIDFFSKIVIFPSIWTNWQLRWPHYAGFTVFNRMLSFLENVKRNYWHSNNMQMRNELKCVEWVIYLRSISSVKLSFSLRFGRIGNYAGLTTLVSQFSIACYHFWKTWNAIIGTPITCKWEMNWNALNGNWKFLRGKNYMRCPHHQATDNR